MTIQRFKDKELQLDHNEYERLCFDKMGNATDADHMSKLVCAKTLKDTKLNSVRYFVRTENSNFVDPNTADFPRIKKAEFKWLQVKEECFGLYMRFLKTGKKLFLHQAERISV